jgi:hypothetical protein
MKSRLKHPIRAIREPFGKAGLTVAILALVFAMVGGAWAAAGLNGKQKKEVTKIAKKFAGKPGAAGTNGTNGSNGAAGAKGDTGAAGSAGAAGKNVVLTAESKGANCKEAGTKVEVEGDAASKKYVCNGSPWTAGGTLPKGSTETGVWSMNGSEASKDGTFGAMAVPISFNIPLAATLDSSHAHYSTEAGFAAVCTGIVDTPTAPSGNLCVYQSQLEHGAFLGFLGFTTEGADKSGTNVLLEVTADHAFGIGSWAVTG